MKKLLLFAAALCFGFYVSAQGIGVGAKFGPGFSNVHGSATKNDEGIKYNKTLVVPHVSFFANYSFGGLISAQVELNYAGKGYKDKYHEDGVNYLKNFSLKYIEIPILAQATFGEDWPVQVYGEFGPYFAFNTSATYGGNKYVGILNYSLKDNFKTIDFGVVIGAGGIYKVLDFLGVLVDLRYTLGLINIRDYPSTHTGEKESLKTGVFNIDFGAVYYIGK
jgi:hypothetical protein